MFPWCWWGTRVTWIAAQWRHDKHRSWHEATECHLLKPLPKPDKYFNICVLLISIHAWPMFEWKHKMLGVPNFWYSSFQRGLDFTIVSLTGCGGSVLFTSAGDQKIQGDQSQQQEKQEEHSETLHFTIVQHSSHCPSPWSSTELWSCPLMACCHKICRSLIHVQCQFPWKAFLWKLRVTELFAQS